MLKICTDLRDRDFCLGRGDIIVFGEQEESRKLDKPKSSSCINITKLIENTVVCKRGMLRKGCSNFIIQSPSISVDLGWILFNFGRSRNAMEFFSLFLLTPSMIC